MRKQYYINRITSCRRDDYHILANILDEATADGELQPTELVEIKQAAVDFAWGKEVAPC